MSWFGNKDLGYEVAKSCGKYTIYTNEKFGCATEWVPIFKTRRWQEAIELTNALNNMDPEDLKYHRDILTKHYEFYWNGSGYEIKVADYTLFVGEDIAAGLLEIIHRKNVKIAKLKKSYISAKYEAEKYKTMLFDLYEKMNEKTESDKYWEIFRYLYPGDVDVFHKLDSKETLKNIEKSLRNV